MVLYNCYVSNTVQVSAKEYNVHSEAFLQVRNGSLGTHVTFSVYIAFSLLRNFFFFLSSSGLVSIIFVYTN